MAVRSSNWESLASLCCGRHAVTSFLNRKRCKYVAIFSQTSPRWDVEQQVSCQETTRYLATTMDQSCEEYTAATIPTNGTDNSDSQRGSLESQSQWFSPPHKWWCRPNDINSLSSPIHKTLSLLLSVGLAAGLTMPEIGFFQWCWVSSFRDLERVVIKREAPEEVWMAVGGEKEKWIHCSVVSN